MRLRRPTGLGHRVQPGPLGGTAHHQQVTAGRGQVDCVGQIVGLSPAPRERAQQPRPTGPEGQDPDDGFVEPLELSVAVPGHAVATVSIVGQGHPVEGHLVAPGDPVLGVDQGGVASGADLPGAEPRLVDPALVAEHPALLPGHLADEHVVHLIGPIDQAAHDIHPALLVEHDSLDHRVGHQPVPTHPRRSHGGLAAAARDAPGSRSPWISTSAGPSPGPRAAATR